MLNLILFLCFSPLPQRSASTANSAQNWAKRNVSRMVSVGIVKPHGTNFDGDKPATRIEVANALASWAKRLETGKWRTEKTDPVPDSAITTLDDGNWESKPLTRNVLADTLARAGDYFAHSLKPAPKGDPTVAKSISLPKPVKVTLTKTNPAFVSVTYLAQHRMLDAGSPLLKADKTSVVKASEFSVMLAQTTVGLVDRVTPINQDKNGSTPDASFHKKRP